MTNTKTNQLIGTAASANLMTMLSMVYGAGWALPPLLADPLAGIDVAAELTLIRCKKSKLPARMRKLILMRAGATKEG